MKIDYDDRVMCRVGKQDVLSSIPDGTEAWIPHLGSDFEVGRKLHRAPLAEGVVRNDGHSVWFELPSGGKLPATPNGVFLDRTTKAKILEDMRR